MARFSIQWHNYRNIYDIYQGGPIDYGTNVSGPVPQSSADSEYNAACTAGMALSNFRIWIIALLKKDSDIFPEEAPLIILHRKSDVCMANNVKDTKHTRHIAWRLNFVRNREKFKMHKIDCCEGGLQLEDITTKNFGENDLNPRMKSIMVRLDNWERTLAQEEW